MSPCHSGDSYDQLCHKCNKGEGDRCLGNALGKCLSGLSPGSVIATIEDGNPEESDPSDYDEIVTTKEAETVDTFSSPAIHTKMKTAHRGEEINMMTQALHIEDRSLFQGLTVQNAYMELGCGSKTLL